MTAQKSKGKALTSEQRKFLRARAHALKPIVLVGQNGITENVVQSIDDALTAHELIKVRLREPEDKKAMAQKLADQAKAHLCGLIGHTLILYRRDPKKPKIQLPKSAS